MWFQIWSINWRHFPYQPNKGQIKQFGLFGPLRPLRLLDYPMRITRQTLQRIANDTVARRVRANRNLLAVYLHGSLVDEANPVLGGTADIDIVFIHDLDHPVKREIVRLTDEVHLDIVHHTRADYRQARQLRLHPQLGPVIYHCQILHDPRHFLDFTQASVRAHFFRPENVLSRARAQMESARQVWFSFQDGVADPGLEEVAEYLQAVANIANAIASLKGDLLSERRFLIRFQSQTAALGHPGLYAGLLGLLGGSSVSVDDLLDWLPAWEQAYTAVGESSEYPIRLHPDRRWYYRRAFDVMLRSEQPLRVLWPLLSTWFKAVRSLPEGHASLKPWREGFQQLGLLGDGFKERINALDVFLDLTEEILEAWGRERGV